MGVKGIGWGWINWFETRNLRLGFKLVLGYVVNRMEITPLRWGWVEKREFVLVFERVEIASKVK